jgi:tRNA U34 2-thiouridine synthase MnmA/TrmU
MIKAIGLLSGGLDSILAVKLMLNQGIEVIALNIVTPFLSRKEARKVAEELNIEIEVAEVGDEYIRMIKNPPHGYGKNMNPCIDCRIFMLKKAKEYMEKIGASFIFTGEVLGQRPMSQRRDTMNLIERESSLEGLILRPLSARLLEPTIPEKEGLVNREKFLAIKGRSRKLQMELAEKLGIKEYSYPAGGCRLTDPQFARRLKESFEHGESGMRDINLLKYGRHFRLHSGAKVIVGRNEEENSILSEFAKEDLLMEVVGFGSPTALLKDSRDERDTKIASSICARYSDCKGRAKVRIIAKDWERSIFVEPMKDEWVKEFRIG